MIEVIDMIGGRKFVFAILLTILSFVLVILKIVESAEWLKFMEVVGGTYVLGNVAVKFIPEKK